MHSGLLTILEAPQARIVLFIGKQHFFLFLLSSYHKKETATKEDEKRKFEVCKQ